MMHAATAAFTAADHLMQPYHQQFPQQRDHPDQRNQQPPPVHDASTAAAAVVAAAAAAAAAPPLHDDAEEAVTSVISAERFHCEICGKGFRQKRTLVNHQLSHSGKRPYECKVCNKRFFWSGSLSRHNRIHTGEKPYKCKICQKQFTQSGTLNRHLRTHTGEKPYLCQLCPRRFSTNSNLAQHLRTHKKNGTFRADAGVTSAMVVDQSGQADAIQQILAAECRKPAFVATALPDRQMVKAAAEAASCTRNSGGQQALRSSLAWSKRPTPSTPLKAPLSSPPVPASSPLSGHSLAQKLEDPPTLGLDPFGMSLAFFNASTLTMDPLVTLPPTHTPTQPKSPDRTSPLTTVGRKKPASLLSCDSVSTQANGSPRTTPPPLQRLWDMEKNVVVAGDGMFECMWCSVRCSARDQLLSHFLSHFGDIY